MSLLEIISKGGYIVWVIGFVGFVGLYITIERFIYYRKSRGKTEDLLRMIKPYLEERDFNSAMNLLRTSNSPVSRVITKGLLNNNRISMESQAREELKNLERNLGLLSSVITISPMLGFLGTVTGMIRAFMQIEAFGGGVNPSKLAGGIWEALITTAVGLVVAIIFVIFYNIFTEKVNNFTHEMNNAIDEISPYIGGK
uniref:MotA/TolQ/ExbB proton channel family protein n=1 Tax=candidate division WOR-3 bacterium TaxID=2052148 RepID=A0A7C4Y8W1_UNCW3